MPGKVETAAIPPSNGAPGIRLSSRRRGVLLGLGLAVLTVAGAAVEYAEHARGDHWLLGLSPLFNLSYEGNIPTWYSSLALAGCAILLWLIGRAHAADGRPAGHWLGLAFIFAYLSMDEAVVIHEMLNEWSGPRRALGGIFIHPWVIPAAVLVAALGAIYLPFLARLPRRFRRLFILAGVLYVGGALGTELPVNAWYFRHGEDLVYGLLNVGQESLEIAGASLFLHALADYLTGPLGGVRISGE